MIRQKKNNITLKRHSIKGEEFQNSNLVNQNYYQNNKQKQLIFEDGILNKFFNININAQNPINYTKKGRKRQLIKSQRPFLLFKDDKNKRNLEKSCQNKQNLQKDIKQDQSKKLKLIQTTGNMMLSFKSFKKKQFVSKLKRPASSVSNSVRSSVQIDNFDNSISRILGEIKNMDSNNTINKDKISTSKAIQIFSKVVRSNQNTSRELMRKKINHSQQRYRSVSVLANKVKIEPKDIKAVPKMEFKSYIKKFKMQKSRLEQKNKRDERKWQDFDLQGWDTTDNQHF